MRNPSKHHTLSSGDERGASMSSELQLRDVRWLFKLMHRIELTASQAFPKTRFYLNLTTTEVKRAERIASALGWHVQHVSQRLAPPLPDRVPRGNPQGDTEI